MTQSSDMELADMPWLKERTTITVPFQKWKALFQPSRIRGLTGWRKPRAAGARWPTT